MSSPVHIASQGFTSFLDKQGSLESAYSKIKHHINKKTGIIPWVEQIPTQYANGAFSIFLAKHSIISNNNSLANLLANIRTSSSAIAPTARQAKILAVCEGLERWACVSQGGEHVHMFSYKDIHEKAIHPKDLHCISEQQYKNRMATNLLHPTGGGFIPEPLDESHEVAWCPVYDMLAQEWNYVLKSSCFFGHHDENHIYSVADSRGVAAGPNLEFCTWHALLELIETDQGAIWNANELICPEVSIESFEDPYMLQLKKVHNEMGRSLWVLDISLDIAGVVIFVAISYDKKTGNIIKGFGTHPLPHKALEKAILECCQMLPNVVKKPSEKTKHASIAPAYLKPDENAKPIEASAYNNRKKAISIADLIDSLSALGIRPFFQDITRPELDLYVVRILGLNMRPWFDRRGPGRLYDVPVNLGMRSTKISENQINPIPLES